MISWLLSVFSLFVIDLKIRNEPRGRLGNFKKSNNAANKKDSASNQAAGTEDSRGSKRKEVNKKIPSSHSIQSFSKNGQASSTTNEHAP